MSAGRSNVAAAAWLRAGVTCLTFFALAGCTGGPAREPIRTVEYVDLERFMGDWYVIANIPTFIEKGAHNAIEGYEIDEDGSIATTFTFRKDSFDGELETHTPPGFVEDPQSNAVWGMQFVWPIKADYRIIYLDDGYQTTVIGRQKRDYVWIMARTPEVDEATWQQLEQVVAGAGYDQSALRRVPHGGARETGEASA